MGVEDKLWNSQRFHLLIVFWKRSILDVWQGSEYAFVKSATIINCQKFQQN